MIIAMACLVAAKSYGQGRHVNTAPSGSVTHVTNFIGFDDSAGTQTNVKQYSATSLVDYVNNAVTLGLNGVLANGNQANSSINLGAVTATYPYNQAVMVLDPTDSSVGFRFQNGDGNEGIYGTTNNGLAKFDVYGAGSQINCAHLGGNSAGPTIVVGSAAGVGGSAAITGSDMAGFISITQGTTGATGSVVATVTFSTAYVTAPRCVIVVPANDEAAETAANVHASASVETDGSQTTMTGFVLFRHTPMSDGPNVARYFYFVVE